MSQSAASSALKEFEQHYGVSVFDRVGKRLQLNELGQAIRPQAEALLDQALKLENAIKQQEGHGHLRVGATLTIGNYYDAPRRH